MREAYIDYLTLKIIANNVAIVLTILFLLVIQWLL